MCMMVQNPSPEKTQNQKPMNDQEYGYTRSFWDRFPRKLPTPPLLTNLLTPTLAAAAACFGASWRPVKHTGCSHTRTESTRHSNKRTICERMNDMIAAKNRRNPCMNLRIILILIPSVLGARATVLDRPLEHRLVAGLSE